MVRNLLLSIPMVFSGIIAHAKIPPELVMSCKVTSQIVVSSEDGKAKQSKSYDDGIVVGDTLEFKLQLSGLDKPELFATLYDMRNFKLMTNAATSAERGEHIASANENGQPSVRYDDGYTRFFLGTDNFAWENVLGRLQLFRYYKSDYHGIYVSRWNSHPVTHVFTLDCRTVKDERDAIMAAFQ